MACEIILCGPPALTETYTPTVNQAEVLFLLFQVRTSAALILAVDYDVNLLNTIHPIIRPAYAKDFVIPHMARRLEKLPTLVYVVTSTQSLTFKSQKNV